MNGRAQLNKTQITPSEVFLKWGSKIGLIISVVLSTVLVLVASPYVANIAGLALSFVVLATCFNLVFGYTGLMSFAQVGFWGIGAYSAALLLINFGIPHWATILLGGIIASILAFILGVPSLRLSEGGFAIVTLTFSLLLGLVAGNWESLTRGRQGIPGLPAPLFRISNYIFDLSQPKPYFVAALIFTVICLSVIYRLLQSRIGRTLIAIRENSTLATSQGINIFRYRLLVFSLAAFFSGVAGGLFIFHLTIVHPSIFDFYYMQAMLIMVIVGGPGTFWPVVVAAITFTVVPEVLRVASDLRLIIYGVLLVVTMLFLPEGVGGILKSRYIMESTDWRVDE